MKPDRTPPRRLGRGLDALLGERTSTQRDPATVPAAPSERSDHTLREIAVADVRPSAYQPRKEFRPDELKELQDSIRSAGLLQPISVRKTSDGYELIAGERRLRAVKGMGWTTVPAIVREYDDRTMLTLALVENLQREDLNPIEEAEGYARLTSDFGMTQNEIAEAVGKDRSTVANLLRVLQLPAEVRRMLESGDLTIGHARPLLALDNEQTILRFAREAAETGLSVRAVEERVRIGAPAQEKRKRGRPRKPDSRSSEVRHVEDLLRRRLQTDVSLLATPRGKGEIRIQFYSTDDLNRLLDLLGAAD